MALRRKAATLQDVATRAGVSVRTVSNVVNDYPHIRPETRLRVEEAVAALGYRINPIARNLRLGSTRMLGLILPELAQPYFAELADSLLATARSHGYSLIVEATRYGDPRESTSVIADLQLMTDGLILSPPHLGPEDPWLAGITVPAIVLSERHFDSGLDHVTMDSHLGSRLAAAHLIDIGRRRIAVIGAPQAHETLSTARHRFNGYLEALTSAGQSPDPRLHRSAEDWTSDHGFRAMRSILDGGAPCDAVMAFNDQLAIGAMHAITVSGRSIPDDIAVTGFDDIASARYLNPPLTTIAPGMDEVATEALKLLLARIEGAASGAGVELRTRAELRARASTLGTATSAA